MLSNKSTLNIINKLYNSNTILYKNPNNLYYNFLTDYSDYNIISNYNQPIIGMIHDNPIEYSQKIDQLSLSNHIYSIVLFHEQPPEALKKEDKYILYQKLKNHHKIFFSEEVNKGWSLPKDEFTVVHRYGVPTRVPDSVPQKNIIIFDLQKNPILEELYKNLKSQFFSVDMIRSVANIYNIFDIIRNYRIAIAIGDSYNTLYCAAHGCFVLSNMSIDKNINSILQIGSLSEIPERVSQILQNFDILRPQTLEAISYIEKKYCVDDHAKLINNVFKQLTSRLFIYEA